MENNYPYIRLFVQRNSDGPDEYILHSVTFCSRTNYRAAGPDPIPAELSADGTWEIKLKVRQHPELPDYESLTPVVHTLALGSVPGGAEGALVKVSISEELPPEAQEGEKPKSVTTLSTISASEESRPIT